MPAATYVGEPIRVPEAGRAARTRWEAALVETAWDGEIIGEPVVHGTRNGVK